MLDVRSHGTPDVIAHALIAAKNSTNGNDPMFLPLGDNHNLDIGIYRFDPEWKYKRFGISLYKSPRGRSSTLAIIIFSGEVSKWVSLI